MLKRSRTSAKNHDKGQALSEYGLIAALIGVAGIAALVLLGNTVNGAFLAMLPSKPTLAVAASGPPSTASSPPQSATSSPAALAPAASPSSASGVSFTTAAGTTISLPAYPPDIRQPVETTGANGTTSLLASNMETLAKQLLEAGEIDQQQYNSLSKLANQGHRISTIEKALEDAAAQASTGKEFKNTPILFEGKSYKPEELRKMIGYSTDSSHPWAVADPLGYPTPYIETKAFMELYRAAESSGALKDPQVQKFVETMASDIAYLTEVTNCTVLAIQDGNIQPVDAREQMISDLSHQDSANICTAGKGKDTGTQCSG